MNIGSLLYSPLVQHLIYVSTYYIYIYYNYTIIIRMGTIQMLGMPIYVLFCQGDGLTLADLDPCLMHCFCIGASRLDLGLGC